MNSHIKWIFKQWSYHKLFVVWLLFLTLLSTAASVAYPMVFRKLFDQLQYQLLHHTGIEQSMKGIYNIAFLLIAVGLVRLVASLYPCFRAWMNNQFEYELRYRYFHSITAKDYHFFDHFRTGDLVTRLTNDLTADFGRISWFMCSGIFRALSSFSSIVFCLFVMFYMSWKLTIMILIPLPFMIVIFYFVSDRLYRTFNENQEAISEINNQLEMSFSGIRIIKAFVCEEKYKRFFRKALDTRFKTEMKVIKLNTIIHLIYEYIDNFALIAVILFGGYMIVQGNISVGTFFAFYVYLNMLIFPILDLPQLFVSGKQAFVCIDRLEEIAQFPVKINASAPERVIQITQIESIEFDKVSFRFDSRELPVLENTSFTINKGEKIAIFGSIGAGKTTLLQLVCGILQPHSGTIRINGYPLSEIDLVSLRDLIGYVPQEATLFSGSIWDNVLFGNSNMDKNDFVSVIETVQLKEEIEQFSEHENTMLGQRGLSLSGGQKQRLSIARALVRKPQLLILDDITASLDASKEELLWQGIGDIFNDITCLIVSHRLSSVRYVDQVIFLDNGSLLGMGTHDILLETNNEYRLFIQEHYKDSNNN